MASQKHERIVGVGNDSIKIVTEEIGGAPNEEADIEFLRMSGTISQNFVQVLNEFKKQEGDVGLFANHAKEIIIGEKCLVWIGEFSGLDIPDPGVIACYVYPDGNSVIPAVVASIKSKQLLRDSRTWDQETFETVGFTLLYSALAFDNLKSQSPRRALTVEEFNAIYQQKGTVGIKLQPFEIKLKPQ